MKTISPYEIIFGVNDTNFFVHTAFDMREDYISMKDFFKKTKEKRLWSIINPGFILSNAYSYFVFGQQHKLLDNFKLDDYIDLFKVTYPNYEKLTTEKKSDLIKRRLRNSIAHCRYEVVINTKDGKITKNGDISFIFKDLDEHKKDKDMIIFEINLPNFGNIIESAGEHCMIQLKIKNNGI